MLVQSFLRKLGVYYRLKSSSLYDFYWRVADKSQIDSRQREIDFYRSLLIEYRPGDVIFDVGANQGSKTDIFLKMDAKVIALDPDEANQKILRQRFLDYRFRKKPVVIVGKAVSDREGCETMWIDSPGCAKNSLSQKWVETLRQDASRFDETLRFDFKKDIQTVTLDRLIETYGKPIFAKIDVEGYEAHVLRGLHHAIRHISFELNLPEFLTEGLECLQLLEDLAEGGLFNLTADCTKGLAMERWLGKREFSEVLSGCREESIEVFWAAPSAAKATDRHPLPP